MNADANTRREILAKLERELGRLWRVQEPLADGRVIVAVGTVEGEEGLEAWCGPVYWSDRDGQWLNSMTDDALPSLSIKFWSFYPGDQP